MSVADEMYIGSVDVWELHEFRWPIVRLCARRAVDRLELRRYMRDLLSTRRWDRVRAVPHREADGRPSEHIYDVFGHPRQPAN